MGKILPILLALVGLAAGGGAGFLLRPPPQEMTEINPCGEGQSPEASPSPTESTDEAADPAAQIHDYVKLNNQFVVPIVVDGAVSALVVMSISLEVTLGATEKVFSREPKLRDAFLQIMFDHANAGGFRGAFTQSNNMDVLRHALLEAAQKVMGPLVSNILIVDIVRQDG